MTTDVKTPETDIKSARGYTFLSLNDTGISASMKSGIRMLSPLHSTLYAMPSLCAFDYAELERAAELLLPHKDELSDTLMKAYPSNAWRCANMTSTDDAVSWLRDFTVGVEHMAGSADFEKREPELYQTERLVRDILKDFRDLDELTNEFQRDKEFEEKTHLETPQQRQDEPKHDVLLPLSRLIGLKTLPVSFEGIRYGEQRQMKTLEREFPSLGSGQVVTTVHDIVHAIHQLCSEWERDNLLSRKNQGLQKIPLLMPASRRGLDPFLNSGPRIETDPVERVLQALTLQTVCATISPQILNQMRNIDTLKQEFIVPALDNLLETLRRKSTPDKTLTTTGVKVTDEERFKNDMEQQQQAEREHNSKEITGVRSLLVGDALTGAVTAFVFVQYPDGNRDTVMSLTTSRDGIMTGGCTRDSMKIDSISDYLKNTRGEIDKFDRIHDARNADETQEEIRIHEEEVLDPDHDGVYNENYRGRLDPTVQDTGEVDEVYLP